MTISFARGKRGVAFRYFLEAIIGMEPGSSSGKYSLNKLVEMADKRLYELDQVALARKETRITNEHQAEP